MRRPATTTISRTKNEAVPASFFYCLLWGLSIVLGREDRAASAEKEEEEELISFFGHKKCGPSSPFVSIRLARAYT